MQLFFGRVREIEAKRSDAVILLPLLSGFLRTKVNLRTDETCDAVPAPIVERPGGGDLRIGKNSRRSQRLISTLQRQWLCQNLLR